MSSTFLPRTLDSATGVRSPMVGSVKSGCLQGSQLLGGGPPLVLGLGGRCGEHRDRRTEHEWSYRSQGPTSFLTVSSPHAPFAFNSPG
jgi:hypothetical protein